MTITRHIALDGPLNGDYLDPETAKANGYALAEWAAGEDAYLHLPNADAFNADGIPAEIAAEIEQELANES